MFNGKLKMLNAMAANWGVAAFMVLGIKHFFSLASTDELQWLLRPLVIMLEILSPLSFEVLTNGEWLENQHHIRIVKACAGVNFFIISLLGYWWLLQGRQHLLSRIISAMLLAWLTTLCANSFRILLSVYAGAALSDGQFLSSSDSHRMIGILSYFITICVQLSLDRRRQWYESMMIAVLLYLTVTLFIPLLRGWSDGQSGLNLAYANWIIGVPLSLLVLAYCANCASNKLVKFGKKLMSCRCMAHRIHKLQN